MADCCLSRSNDATAHRNPLCSDPTAPLLNQQKCSISHVLYCSDTVLRSRQFPETRHHWGRRPIRKNQGVLRYVCGNRSRCQRIDGDSMAAAKLASPTCCQAILRHLHRVVDRGAHGDKLGYDRADIDDATAFWHFAFDNNSLGHVDGAVDVGAEVALENLRRCLQKSLVGIHSSSIVD